MSASHQPPDQFLQSELVPAALADENARCLSMSATRVAVLGAMAGAFVTIGALLSVVVSSGIAAEGPRLLVAGGAFAVGYFFVALARAALFTEANVALPDVLLQRRQHKHILRYWVLSFVFNFVGAFVFGWLVYVGQSYSTGVNATLDEIVASKMSYQNGGGAAAWGRVVVSGVLANFLVGLGFFFAFMARSVIGKFIPLVLAVIVFEAANFQHSPANMGYFSLIMPTGRGPGWADAVWWNITPAALGNIIGGAILVALPFWYVFGVRHQDARSGSP